MRAAICVATSVQVHFFILSLEGGIDPDIKTLYSPEHTAWQEIKAMTTNHFLLALIRPSIQMHKLGGISTLWVT